MPNEITEPLKTGEVGWSENEDEPGRCDRRKGHFALAGFEDGEGDEPRS